MIHEHESMNTDKLTMRALCRRTICPVACHWRSFLFDSGLRSAGASPVEDFAQHDPMESYATLRGSLLPVMLHNPFPSMQKT